MSHVYFVNMPSMYYAIKEFEELVAKLKSTAFVFTLSSN